MESVLAIGVGLVLRVVLDVVTDNDDRVGSVFVGLWEGVVLNHFIRRMPRSFDPYIGFGFRIFVDFLFTQSFSRFALVAIWALVGMLLADIAPNVWHDSGLRRLYRRVCKDVRRIKRAFPRIRIKNDLPSVRIFNHSRSTSTVVSGSIRSDRATPSHSPVPSPRPTPGPARRPGRTPPGALPDLSGWSETETEVTTFRGRVVTNPGPSPALIPSRERAGFERIDATRVTTSRTRTTPDQGTTITITQTQNESVLLETTATLGATAVSMLIDHADDPSRHDPPLIPDDWVDVTHPTVVQSNDQLPPCQPVPEAPLEPQPGPSTLVPSRPASILDPHPVLDVLPDIPDFDLGDRSSRPPHQIPLPESRAASMIGGVYDQPQPRSAWRESVRSRVDKASSETGVDSSKPLAPFFATQSTKSQSASHGWTRSRLKHSLDAETPEAPPKDVQTPGGQVVQGKTNLGAVQGPEPQISSPAQVDLPASVLTQPGDVPLRSTPAVTKPKPEQQQSKLDPPPADDVGVDSHPTPPQGGADHGDTAGPSKTSLFDVSSPSRTPPPPFSEFAGVQESPTAEEAPAEEDPITQDEAPTELIGKQKATEEKRMAFLLTQVQELEKERIQLQIKLDEEDDTSNAHARAILSDLEDAEKTLSAVKARIAKKKFSEPPLNPSIPEVSLSNKLIAADVQFTVTSTILEKLLTRDDAGPMTIRFVINKQKALKGKAKDAKDAVTAFAKRHNLEVSFGPATPGIIDITF